MFFLVKSWQYLHYKSLQAANFSTVYTISASICILLKCTFNNVFYLKVCGWNRKQQKLFRCLIFQRTVNCFWIPLHNTKLQIYAVCTQLQERIIHTELNMWTGGMDVGISKLQLQHQFDHKRCDGRGDANILEKCIQKCFKLYCVLY